MCDTLLSVNKIRRRNMNTFFISLIFVCTMKLVRWQYDEGYFLQIQSNVFCWCHFHRLLCPKKTQLNGLQKKETKPNDFWIKFKRRMKGSKLMWTKKKTYLIFMLLNEFWIYIYVYLFVHFPFVTTRFDWTFYEKLQSFEWAFEGIHFPKCIQIFWHSNLRQCDKETDLNSIRRTLQMSCLFQYYITIQLPRKGNCDGRRSFKQIQNISRYLRYLTFSKANNNWNPWSK